jgi:hypothetical protein
MKYLLRKWTGMIGLFLCLGGISLTNIDIGRWLVLVGSVLMISWIVYVCFLQRGD